MIRGTALSSHKEDAIKRFFKVLLAGNDCFFVSSLVFFGSQWGIPFCCRWSSEVLRNFVVIDEQLDLPSIQLDFHPPGVI